MKKGSARKPECHPNRKHYAKGLCASCYHAQAVKRKKKAKHKEPVRVIHTHEVIRQVQNEEKQTMAAHDEPKAHEPKAEPLKRAEGASKESVVSPAGTTEPTIEFGGDGVTPKAEFDEKYKEVRAAQAKKDEERRQRAIDDAGVVQLTPEGKAKLTGAKHNG